MGSNSPYDDVQGMSRFRTARRLPETGAKESRASLRSGRHDGHVAFASNSGSMGRVPPTSCAAVFSTDGRDQSSVFDNHYVVSLQHKTGGVMIASVIAIAMLGQLRPDTILDDRMRQERELLATNLQISM